MWLALLLAGTDVRITAPSPEAARNLARERMSVYAVRGSEVFAVAPDDTIAALRARGYDVREIASVAREEAYQTPEQINAAIQAVQGSFKLETLGHSVQGVPILGLRMGDPSMPSIRILGGHHGDEPPSFEFPLRIAEAIAKSPPANVHLLIVPMVNPDGLRAHARYNARGVDLNRNYSYRFSHGEYAAGDAPFSEPETAAVALDNDYHRYAASLTYHTGAFNVGYPYNCTLDAMTAEALLSGYAQRYKEHVHAPAFEALRGASWFISYGDTNDYSFGYFGGVDFTVELSSIKAPPQSALPALWDEHLDAALDWLMHAQETRVVTVTDARDGSPLPANVVTASTQASADPVRGIAQVQEAGPFMLRYPGYEQSGDAQMTPNAASDRARALITPFAAGKDDRLAYPHGDFAGLRAIRAGSDDISFACADGVCVAPAMARRPGHYDLVVGFDDESEGNVRNALLLIEETGSAVSVDGSAYVTSEDAWLVERGGSVRRFDNGRIEAPVEPMHAIDVVWQHEGVLLTQTMADPQGPLGPFEGGNTRGRSHGCQGAPLDLWASAVLGVGVGVRRRRTSAR